MQHEIEYYTCQINCLHKLFSLQLMKSHNTSEYKLCNFSFIATMSKFQNNAKLECNNIATNFKTHFTKQKRIHTQAKQAGCA